MRISRFFSMAAIGIAVAMAMPIKSHSTVEHALGSHRKRDMTASHLEKRHMVHWLSLLNLMFGKVEPVKPPPAPEIRHYSLEEQARNYAKYLMCLLNFLNGPREERVNDYTMEERYCFSRAGPFQGKRYYGLDNEPGNTSMTSEDIRIERAKAKTEEQKRKANGEPSPEELWNEIHRVWREVRGGSTAEGGEGEGHAGNGQMNMFSVPSLKELSSLNLPAEVAESLRKAFGGRRAPGKAPPLIKSPRPI